MQTVSVPLSPAYTIQIGPGARLDLANELESLEDVERIAVIVDRQVLTLHRQRLAEGWPVQPAAVISVPPGEASKSLDEAARLYDALAEVRISRRDLVVTVGGGVTGDLGGFVAATWLRGVRFLQMPTTLEAAIDAAVGGKTGVNHRTGKNLIGAFHQPAAVLVDTDLLESLPQREYVAALAESVKHALIRDVDLLAWHESNLDAILAREPETLIELIARNCTIKAGVVARDEREASLRMMLNFGHTIGHAIEHLLGYELRHGECVSLGMVAANALAKTRGILDPQVAERIVVLLERVGLPVRLPHALDAQQVVAACHRDKKVSAGAIRFVLLEAPGRTVFASDVTDAEITAALDVVAPA